MSISWADIQTQLEQRQISLAANAKLVQDSRKIQSGDVFVALKGHEQDGAAPDIDIDFFGLGAEQHLSKRTHLYALLGMQTTDVAGSETDTDVFLVGAKHKF